MKSFKQYLLEAVSLGQIEKVNSVISSYFSKKMGSKLHPITENLQGGGFGLRYFVPFGSSFYSFRINWSSPSKTGSVNVESVDVWYGNKNKGHHVEFDKEQSLVKVIPMIYELLSKGEPAAGPIVFLDDGEPVKNNESINMIESVEDPNFYKNVVEFITSGSFTESSFYSKFKKAGEKIRDELVKRKSSLWEISGKKYTWVGSDKDKQELESLKDSVLDSLGTIKAKVSSGTKKIDETPTPKDDFAKLPLESQIELLNLGVKNLITVPSTKFLVVTGAGGVGKSHNIQKAITNLGVKKSIEVKGSISNVGLYQALYDNNGGIIVIDDADSFLKPNNLEGFNIIKAATDSKANRTISWFKRIDDTAEDGEQYPRSFEFTGKLIIISNKKKYEIMAIFSGEDPSKIRFDEKGNPIFKDKSILTRAKFIDIRPSDDQMFEYFQKIYTTIDLENGKMDNEKRKKVLEELISNYKSNPTGDLSIRTLKSKMESELAFDLMGLNDAQRELCRKYL